MVKGGGTWVRTQPCSVGPHHAPVRCLAATLAAAGREVLSAWAASTQLLPWRLLLLTGGIGHVQAHWEVGGVTAPGMSPAEPENRVSA